MSRKGNDRKALTVGGHRDPQYLLETIVKERCTHLFFVPSLLTVLLEHLELERAGCVTAPRHVFCVGEALLPQTAHLFFAAFAGGGPLHRTFQRILNPRLSSEPPRDGQRVTRASGPSALVTASVSSGAVWRSVTASWSCGAGPCPPPRSCTTCTGPPRPT